MRNVIKVLVCTTAAFGLTGCQSFLAELGLAKRGVSDVSVAQDTGTSRLDLGRAALKAGAPGTAIHHFERAVLDPTDAPAAYNGMGVAYAQLGREDLAERFFNAALMMRPNDTRITRNLERLYASELGNSRRANAAKEGETNKLLAKAEADAFAKGYLGDGAVDDRGPVSIDNRRRRTHRDSKREIILSDAQPLAPKDLTNETVSRAPIESDVPAAIQIEQAPSQLTKIAATPPDASKYFDYANIICLDGSKPKPAGTQYPIRISLQDVSGAAKGGK